MAAFLIKKRLYIYFTYHPLIQSQREKWTTDMEYTEISCIKKKILLYINKVK